MDREALVFLSESGGYLAAVERLTAAERWRISEGSAGAEKGHEGADGGGLVPSGGSVKDVAAASALKVPPAMLLPEGPTLELSCSTDHPVAP